MSSELRVWKATLGGTEASTGTHGDGGILSPFAMGLPLSMVLIQSIFSIANSEFCVTSEELVGLYWFVCDIDGNSSEEFRKYGKISSLLSLVIIFSVRNGGGGAGCIESSSMIIQS